MDSQHVRVSKFLSYVLRHRPDSIGVELDSEGWVEIDQLIEHAGIALDIGLIRAVVATSDKQRFALSADGHRIRANQGHSIDVDLGLEPIVPPDRLFHGTATRFAQSIAATGLSPRTRRYVHLSGDSATARKVGSRHGTPVVLTVDAAKMHGDGHCFFQADNGVWLAAFVPAAYLTFPDPATAVRSSVSVIRLSHPSQTHSREHPSSG